MFLSLRSRQAFVIAALQDVEEWMRLARAAGFVVDQRLEAPLGPDGTFDAEEGVVVLALRQSSPPPGSEPETVRKPLWRR
jgi:hypothetical protein